MAKRFIDTELWDEDWFLALNKDERQFFQYLFLTCDHAGIWKPNWEKVKRITELNIIQAEFIEKVNRDKVRVLVLESGRWWLTGFVQFQYGNGKEVALTGSTIHQSVLRLLIDNGIPYKDYSISVRETLDKPFTNPSERVKDKDKDRGKDKDVYLGDRGGGKGEQGQVNKTLVKPAPAELPPQQTEHETPVVTPASPGEDLHKIIYDRVGWQRGRLSRKEEGELLKLKASTSPEKFYSALDQLHTGVRNIIAFLESKINGSSKQGTGQVHPKRRDFTAADLDRYRDS